MDQKPSLILPVKRFRYSSQKCLPSLVLKLSNKNTIKKLDPEELFILKEYTNNNPGEYYKTEYWNNAIVNKIKLNYTPDVLRLMWMHYFNSNDLEFSLSVKKSEKVVEKNDLGKTKICIVAQNESRTVFDLEKMEKIAEKKKIVENFNKLLEKCRKITKNEITPLEVLEMLKKHNGKSKDLLENLITTINKHQLPTIYNDCCSLSQQTLPYNHFLSAYIKNEGTLTALYNYYAKVSNKKTR